MNGKQIVNTLDSLLSWIVRLTIVNGLWILFSLIGLFALGVFPATTAALGISRKWFMGEVEIKIWPMFLKIYKQEFIKSNILGWILTLAGLLLYTNYKLMAHANDDVFFIIPFAFFLLLFFYTIIFLWSFPLLAHYQANLFIHLKNAFIIGLTKIHITVAIGLVMIGVIYFTLEFPALLLFLTFSIAATGTMWFARQVFEIVDGKDT